MLWDVFHLTEFQDPTAAFRGCRNCGFCSSSEKQQSETPEEYSLTAELHRCDVKWVEIMKSSVKQATGVRK